jgi:hypothetical protein
MMLIKNPDNSFSVSNGTEVVFTGPLAAAMQLHAKLSYAARTPAKDSNKMAKREEKRQAGVR